MSVTTTPGLTARSIWPRILIVVGSIAMLVGALDPLEGSLLILPGSGLVALGTFLGQNNRRLVTFRVWVFVLIAFGVGALWGLTVVGGIGGNSGHSMWWGVLTLPYLIGWSVSTWGPRSPRWVSMLGIVVGLWYLAILAMVFKRSGGHNGDMSVAPMVIGAIGVLTIGGCISRLRKRTPEQQ